MRRPFVLLALTFLALVVFLVAGRLLWTFSNETRARQSPPASAGSSLDEIGAFQEKVQQLARNGDFGQLDAIAARARSEKSRFAGGMWILNAFYHALREPPNSEGAGDAEWNAWIAQLIRWKTQRPESITARVALAGSYIRFGWKARGSGYADTVSTDASRLFQDRVKKAEEELKAATKLQEKCPQWFSEMQNVARAQGWELSRITALFDKAIQFEPQYQYFYRSQANLLLPKWYGEQGDSEKFSLEIADRIGGVQGDFVYFEIAASMICSCDDETTLQSMSWARMQAGYAASGKLYGESLLRKNQLAYMAVKKRDAAVAAQMFSAIADRWDPDIWRERSYFEDCRTWASNPNR